MKRLLLFFLFLQTFPGKVLAQKTEIDSIVIPAYFRNSVYAELLGNGVAGSLNYERRFYLPKSKATMMLRLGGMFLPKGRDRGNLEYEMMIPVEVTFLRGKKATKLELGGGLTYYKLRDYYTYYDGSFKSGKEENLIPVCRVGGRWQLPDKPYFFRFAFTPFVFIIPLTSNGVIPFFPWAGFSFGYSFGK